MTAETLYGNHALTEWKALAEAQERAISDKIKVDRLAHYVPYNKQKEFHAAGAAPNRERLFMAGNQLGKCCSFNSLVEHPDGTATKAGVLFQQKASFDVWAWDGKTRVPAAVSHAVKKPAEPLVRLHLSSGDVFECALNHRVLTRGGWTFVVDLLAAQAFGVSGARSVRASGVRRWWRKAQDFFSNCCAGFRLCGAPLLSVSGDDLASATSEAGVLRYSQPSSRLGATAHTHTNSGQEDNGHLSNPDDRGLHGVRSVVFLIRAACTSVPRTTWIRRTVQQLATVANVVLLSVGSVFRDRRYSWALVSPIAGNHVIRYEYVGVQDVYDFTVPGYENYVSCGIVHHNTLAGAAEVAMHLTGRYPAWWAGRRYDRPTIWLAGSESSELTRDGVQRLLMGPPQSEEEWGTGFIPKDALTSWSRKQGTPNALDNIAVRHKNGGTSYVNFKSYDQGRGKWQAATVDGVWFDEEPDMEVYSEGLTRTNATRGFVMLTFTPLLGMSEVVMRYLMTPTDRRKVITMTIYDAEHYSAEEKANTIADYPEHERDARASGIPILGSGRVFPVADATVLVPPFPIPSHFKRLGCMDFGYDHPFAAAELVYDADQDVVYVAREYREAKKTPDQHCTTLRLWGKHLSWAWPHDGYREDRGGKDGAEELRLQYKRHGLSMLGEHATFSSGGFSTEAGVQEMLMRMNSGRWKVFDGMCPRWMEEFRLYHRKDGKIVKEMDDLMSCSRIGTMMLRHAKIVAADRNPWGHDDRPAQRQAEGVGEVNT